MLLTGPARGYVKCQLEQLGIPYRHDFINDYKQIVRYYAALDLYLVTSREEGGPMALMESMATHVPVVSTRVGQADDLLVDGVTGGLVDVDDVKGLVERSLFLLSQSETASTIRASEARRKVVDEFDWRHVAAAHYEKVYKPLLL